MKNEPSMRYQGGQGKDYFAYQNRFAAKRAKLKYRRFSRHISEKDRVLDFGCGGGWVLSQANCALRVGVEVNEAARDVCHTNGITVYRDVDAVKERDFDVAISCHCLEHVPCPTDALSSIAGLLKPGGKLVLIVPIDDWRGQKDFVKRGQDHHLHTWTPRLLANTLVDAGFEVVHVRVLTRQWFPKWNLLIDRIPDALFDLGCVLWGWIYRQRELLAVATKPVAPPVEVAERPRKMER